MKHLIYTTPLLALQSVAKQYTLKYNSFHVPFLIYFKNPSTNTSIVPIVRQNMSPQNMDTPYHTSVR